MIKIHRLAWQKRNAQEESIGKRCPMSPVRKNELKNEILL